MLRKENDCYKKLTLLNDSQENIIAVFNQTGALAIMTCKIKYDGFMAINEIDYSIYKVFDNTVAFDISNRIAFASIRKDKEFAASIDCVAVAEAERNSGYGTAVVTRLINDATLLNVTVLYGSIYKNDIDTSEKLARFDHFYRKLGFHLDYNTMKMYRNI